MTQIKQISREKVGASLAAACACLVGWRGVRALSLWSGRIWSAMCIAPGALHPVHDNNNQSCKLFSTCGFCLQAKSAGVSSLLQEARASRAYWCTLLSCRILEFEQAFPSHKRTCSRRHSSVTDLHTHLVTKPSLYSNIALYYLSFTFIYDMLTRLLVTMRRAPCDGQTVTCIVHILCDVRTDGKTNF